MLQDSVPGNILEKIRRNKTMLLGRSSGDSGVVGKGRLVAVTVSLVNHMGYCVTLFLLLAWPTLTHQTSWYWDSGKTLHNSKSE